MWKYHQEIPFGIWAAAAPAGACRKQCTVWVSGKQGQESQVGSQVRWNSATVEEFAPENGDTSRVVWDPFLYKTSTEKSNITTKFKKQNPSALETEFTTKKAWRTGFLTKHWLLNEPVSFGKHKLRWMSHQILDTCRPCTDRASRPRIQKCPEPAPFPPSDPSLKVPNTSGWPQRTTITFVPRDNHQMHKTHIIALKWLEQA